MASQKAKQMDMFLNGLHDSSGQPLKGYKAYFWVSSSASVAKDVWSDINKSSVINQSSGITLGNSGEIDIYGDGEYFVQIKTSAGALYDTFNISYSTEVDFGGLYIDVGTQYGTNATAIEAALADTNVSQNYTFLFKDAVFTVGQALEFPENILVKGMVTGTINQTANSITINRTPDIPDFQFFTGSPSVTWGAKVQEVRPIWTGGDATITGTSFLNGVSYKLVSKTATYTAANESVILVDASSGAVTISLPASSGLSGREYTIKKTDSSVNAVTIDGNASETIDGATTKIIYTQYAGLTIVCDGSNWFVVKSFDEQKNIILQNTTPKITLKDINGGSNEAQQHTFESADGEYVVAEAKTTGSGIGDYSIKTKASGDSGVVERIRIGSDTQIKTQHIKTMSGGIISWTGIQMSAGQFCTLLTQGGHIAGELFVRGVVSGSARDFIARYGVACDSWSPYTSIALLDGSLTASALSVFWTSDDLKVKVVDDSNGWATRTFNIALHYTGDGINYISSPTVSSE